MSTGWFDDDRLWEQLGEDLLRPQRWNAASREAEQLVELLDLEPPAEILDLCCGPGRYALELAKRGFRVTGVDRTQSYLDELQSRAGKAGVEITGVCQDMRSFCRPGAFDGAVNLFTSFGYFEDPADDEKVVRQLHQSLRPGSRAVLTLLGKEVLARFFQPNNWVERDGEVWLFERRITQGWTWFEQRWIRLRDGRREEFRLANRPYSAAELSALFRRCGFSSSQVFGDLDRSPYDHEARRLVLVAEA